MPDSQPILMVSILVSSLLLGVGMVLSFVRLLLGPSLPDRVVAADVLATMMIGVLVLTSLTTAESFLLDIALAIALVVFLGTIALAIAIERGIFK